ncbi:MAG: alanine racemase [Neisseriaceae bacterium]|jgi:alanine racemase|nr:MAG: alanine racemase [Neisseriaceae bacterium]
MHPTKIIINKEQFTNNLISLKTHVGMDRKLCLPVKANAYGHGLVQTAKIAESFVDYLAVACLDEGIALKKNGIKKPVLVFGSFDNEQISDLIKFNLEITVTSLDKAKALEVYCRTSDTICRVHVKFDSGMNRVGALDSEIKELIEYVAKNPVLQLIGVYSHLASSDSPDNELTHQQINKFKEIAKLAKKLKPDVICHLANSGGVAYYPESWFDMVRPGIISYGYYPSKAQHGHIIKVRPCLSLHSRIMHIKKLPEGLGVSYSHRFTTAQESNIATLAIGYGDGFRRCLSNRGQEVIINGKKYPIVGNICMDMLMVNLGNDSANVGDDVLLIGTQSNEMNIPLESISEKLGTIDYEVLVGFTNRVVREYA